MDVHAQNDIELLRQYAESGSASAFATVVARHADFVFAVALRQTRSRELAEDVTQAVFIVLARRARGLREGASVAAFLHQTTVFAAKNALRAETRRRRHEKQAAIDPAAADASKKNEPMDNGAVAVDCALAQLRDGDRQFLMLHYFDGLNVDDLAARLKISHEAARKRLHRALARLRANLTRAGTAPTVAALPTLVAALAHPAASINASAVASTAVAGGINGRAFGLAHRVSLHIKLLAVSKTIAAITVVTVIAAGTVISINHFQQSGTRTISLPTLAAGTSAPAAPPVTTTRVTVVDYALVFSEMQETKDEKRKLEQELADIEQTTSKRQAEINQMRKTRDAAPKGSPEYARLDEALSQAIAALDIEGRTTRRIRDATQVHVMKALFQKIEIAVTAVGATHHLNLVPPTKPAYPARPDTISVNEMRQLLLRRALPHPDGAPDLTQEVIAYLNSHRDIPVPGIPSTPPDSTTQVAPSTRQ